MRSRCYHGEVARGAKHFEIELEMRAAGHAGAQWTGDAKSERDKCIRDAAKDTRKEQRGDENGEHGHEKEKRRRKRREERGALHGGKREEGALETAMAAPARINM